MGKVEVDAEWLGMMRLYVDAVHECMTDEFRAELNDYCNFDSVEKQIKDEAVHPIDKIGSFKDIPKIIGTISNDEYDALMAAWSILLSRARKYKKAMSAVDAWIPSHDQGEVYWQLEMRYVDLMSAVGVIGSVRNERPTSNYCRQHPDDKGCP